MTIKIEDRPEVRGKHPYPVLANVLGRDQASAVETLYRYVRPEGDYILVRSELDHLDEAFRQIEEHLKKKWNGQSWSTR